MAAPIADKDAKNTADLFFAAREYDIGTVVEPKASEEVILFIKEHMLTMAHFTAANDEPARYSELVVRKEAFGKIPGFTALCRDLAVKNNAGVDKKAPESVRTLLHDCLREVRVLMQMYEAARTKGPAINPDGHHRANGASANAIRLNVGGLASYLTHGESTAVSLLATAITSQRAKAAATTLATQQAVAPPCEVKRPIARNDPPAQRFPCGYCGKVGHTAQDCRLRAREEGPRPTVAHAPVPPRAHHPATAPVTADAALFAAFAKWQKENQ